MKNNVDENIYTIIISNTYIDSTVDRLMEFISLVSTAGYKTISAFKQKVVVPDPSTYIRKGLIGKIKEYLLAFFDENPNLKDKVIIATGFDLSGTQRANLKKILGVEVVDRTFIILKIFENNAHTKEAKLQVDIASLTWSKNHLVNSEGAFSQVTSGGGLHNKGSGEKQITLDRRHISNLIEAKKKELEKIKQARKNARTKRNNSGLYKIAIVGYTNAGKSTLMNSLLSFSDGQKMVLTKNALFATLETSTREITKYGFMKLLFTDTVGFVRNLPTTLVEAFKSTLEEIKETDLLVHVVDYSNKEYEEQIQTTNDILKEIGANDIPMIYLYNKYDLVGQSKNSLLENNSIYTSLINENESEDIYRFICTNLSKDWEEYKIEFPYENNFGEFCFDNYVLSSVKIKNGYYCTVRINPRTKYKYTYLLDKNC